MHLANTVDPPATGARRGTLVALLVLLPLIVAISATCCLASAWPPARGTGAAAESVRSDELPPIPPALAFSRRPPSLHQGLFLVAQADLPQPPTPPESTAPEPAAEARPVVFPPEKADWPALMRDTGYLIGYQFLGFLILYVAPESVSNWSEEDKEHYDFRKWMHNVTHPTVDEDKWWINYILHPYWGSAYFLDARGRGFGRWGSFWYSFLASNLYEFGTEAFAEEASIQDIFVTPIGGALLGMALEDTWRRLVLKGESRTKGESVLLYLISPLGEVNNDVDHLFGIESARTAVNVLPVIGPVPGRGTYAGLQLTMRW